MKAQWNLMLTICIAGAASASAKSPLQNTDVFVSGTHGYHTFRIPAIEAAADGSLIALAEARPVMAGESDIAFISE